jgi:hypothetical protein
MIIVCNEGYSSSLAAASLRQLGIGRATDLIGGFQPGNDSARKPKCVRWRVDSSGHYGHI